MFDVVILVKVSVVSRRVRTPVVLCVSSEGSGTTSKKVEGNQPRVRTDGTDKDIFETEGNNRRTGKGNLVNPGKVDYSVDEQKNGNG